MSGLREERVFGDALVQGIRGLWWAEVFAKTVKASSPATPAPTGIACAIKPCGSWPCQR